MRTLGPSNPRLFNSETGKEIKSEKEFKLAKNIKLEVDFELLNYDTVLNKILANISWLVRTIDLEILVPNNKFKRELISALHSDKKEALPFKNFKTLKVIKYNYKGCYDGRIRMIFNYSAVDVPYATKRFFEITGKDKLNFLNSVEKLFIYKLYELTTKFENLTKYINKIGPKFKFNNISCPDTEHVAKYFLK